MSRVLVFGYGLLAYLLFVAAFVYLVGFVAGVVVPKHVDSGAAGGIASSLVVDALLVLAFGATHSVMARPWFKRRWTRLLPPSIERATFVLVASLALGLLFWQWRPLSAVIWEVRSGPARLALELLAGAGWVLVLASSVMVSHADLVGLRQVAAHLRGRPYRPPLFVVRSAYRYVRHPMMLGFLVAFWSTPVMTLGHLWFAALMSLYLAVALPLEERDLVRELGPRYVAYQRRVPMLVPLPRHPDDDEPERPAAAASDQSQQHET